MTAIGINGENPSCSLVCQLIETCAAEASYMADLSDLCSGDTGFEFHRRRKFWFSSFPFTVLPRWCFKLDHDFDPLQYIGLYYFVPV